MLKIGTRESPLAVWQAEQVKTYLESQNCPSEFVFVKSTGDIDLQTPLYEVGVSGIFTRTLDLALLSGQIDCAVHSLKDVPTVLPKGLVAVAVLPRADYRDVLVLQPDLAVKKPAFSLENGENGYKIATSSIRRKAQWLNRFSDSSVDNIRGNVNTRLEKVRQSDWHGAIFAAAGLARLGLLPETAIYLDWMLPAPAQGAIVVTCRAEDTAVISQIQGMNHAETAVCVDIERAFLRTLEGGCSAPIAALATIEGDNIYFQGNLCSLDGREKLSIAQHYPLSMGVEIGQIAAETLLQKGGDRLMAAIRAATPAAS